MHNVSDSYKMFIKKPSRSFECRITLGNRVFNNSDIIQIVPTVVQPSDRFSIGNTVSQNIDITLKNDGAAYASVGEIDVEIGLKINNSIEYIPFGTFNIDDVSKTDYTVKLTCYDNMVKFETGYFSKLGNNPTLQEVVNELATITGVQFTGTLQNYTVTKLEGYTCREVLAYVASVCGGNAYITRDNKFTIIYPHEVDCTITADNYFSTGHKLEDQVYKIGMITCQNKSNSNNDSSESDDYDSVNDKNTISVGSLSSDTMELTFENPWVTQSILNDIYNKLKNFSYLGYTLKWQGDLSLDPLDIITVVDKNNVTRKALVYANKLTYNGGLSAETSAKGETKNSNSFSASGSTNKNIERLSVKLLIAEKAIINKANISDLQANSARIDKLDANVATINTALINYATVDQLDAVKANVSNLNASIANIDSALINKANVADLTAAKATISNVSADVANIKTLIGGNLTIANMQSLVLTSSKVTVDNGFIKNAMIESLDATKINTGSLNTSKISVTSSDGSLLIAGATQQFKDKNGKVRIQMGQDAQGNFNFILVASDGATTLIDGTGVKEKAIADKLIKTNMVADQAIGSQQINYSSFATGFNASTNTNFIKASKVAIDLTGQTLDIAFNNMNTTVTSVQTTANTAKSTADTASSNASSAVSTANSANTNASTALSNANNAVSTANTAKTTATTASTNASNAVNTANSANSTANTANTNANTAVNTANTALSTANNIQVGGRNLLIDTDEIKYLNVNIPTSYTVFDPYSTYNRKTLRELGFVANDIVTISFNWDIDKNGSLSEVYGNFRLEWKGINSSGIDNQYLGLIKNPVDTFSSSNTNGKAIVTTQLTESVLDAHTVRFRIDNSVITFKVSKMKLEKGNKSTDWTPAPEDIDQAITSVKTVTETNTTSINAIQGQISTLISNTTITAIDGTTTQLKDAYNGTVNTINSMKTTIGEHTTDIDANTKNITSVTSRTSTLETNLSSISASLSSTKSTVDTHTTQISTANTNITTALNNASSALNTANTANTTANSAKTTATTASTNASNAVTTANSASSNASTALTNSNTAISTANTASTNASNAVSTANKASTDVATLTTTVTNTVSRVSSLELTTSGLTTRVGNTETTLSNLQVGGRNLCSKTCISGFGTTLTSSNYDYAFDAGTGGKGIKISSSIFQLSTNYVLSFKIKKNSGNLYRIGGHNELFASSKLYIDGVLIDTNKYANPSNNLPNDSNYHKVVLYATTVSSWPSDNNLYIQPNRSQYDSACNVTVSNIKVEQGNLVTDWSPAPEDVDSSIASVKDYATQTINSNVSTINQTTDSIKASVQSLQSSVNTINTTLGNKADSSTVTSVTNRVSTLETGVNGINASITTLNSNVSSVTTTANAAKSAIDNLNIGGRNLLKNTGNFLNLNSWGLSKGSGETGVLELVSDQIYGNVIHATKTNSVSWWVLYNYPITLPSGKFVAGQQYTFSCIAKANTNGSALVIDFRDGNGTNGVMSSTKTFNLTTSWVSYSFTFTAIATGNTPELYITTGIDEIWLTRIKLEEGNQATSWTPAPEDVDYQITTINSSVSSLQSSVSVLQNQIALKVEQSNIDSAVTTINGQISAQNTTISSLQSQINVQAGQISSKVEQTDFNAAFKKNYITNPLLVNDTSGWNVTGNHSIQRSTTSIRITGVNTLYIASTGTGGGSTGLVYTSINVVSGKQYTLSFYAYSSNSILLHSELWGSINAVDFPVQANTWTKFTRTFTASTTGTLYFWLQSSGFVLLSEIKLEDGTAATNFSCAIGTTITQSTTEVMTAFNNISRYFQVSADGAKFGDFTTGAYTKMSQKGLEHVDSYGAMPYHYYSYMGQAIIEMNGTTQKDMTFNFPQEVIDRLEGTIPYGLASVSFYSIGFDQSTGCIGCAITNITATTITLRAYLSSEKLVAISTPTNPGSEYETISTQIYAVTGSHTGSVCISYLIIG
ncbi:beta strand repeat-containing protein [Clostridium beijerinckii]|uniref:CBM-cenC domain-containing protein n=1 Tax=Clostridium beijerinckii TaxID=1520 RepID=A0A7X9XNT4_CLOBE|nr:carbohydrate binding domain-containing protein [Clostridium beijerinckii]NMF04578.1 hypothetical protein [Clostridium beijerinckii]